MERMTFEAGGKPVTLHRSAREDSPLILMNDYEGDGTGVLRALREIGAPECHLLVVSGLRWNHDMTPWSAPPVMAGDDPCTGGADEYLRLLLERILPEARSRLGGAPRFTGLAGYSLAGLFALYALYRCDAFDRAASMSGSLWFPGFAEYALTHELRKRPDRLYLSLGDRECRTRNPQLKSVQERTEQLADHWKRLGLEVQFELNPGNHFRDAELRIAKGIRAMLA